MKQRPALSFRDPKIKQQNQKRVEKFWARYFARFPTEEDAQLEIERRCLKMKEPCCRKPKLRNQPGGRSAKCNHCKTEVWFTAGTFFDGIRHCAAWLAAIMCHEQRIEMAPAAFAKHIGCSGSTAWEIFHKIRMAIAMTMQRSGNSIESEAFFTILTRRSRETPARQHPSAEIIELRRATRRAAKHKPKEDPADPVVILQKLSQDDRCVYDALSEEPMHCDVLIEKTGIAIGALTAVLVTLEIEGLVKMIGGRYIRTKAASSTTNNRQTASSLPLHSNKTLPQQPAATGSQVAAISPQKSSAILKSRQNQNQDQDQSPSKSKSTHQTKKKKQEPGSLTNMHSIIDYFGARHHGFSRKYLQLYIAGLWCYAAPEQWPKDCLFRLCMASEQITREDVRGYVSDLYINIPYLRSEFESLATPA